RSPAVRLHVQAYLTRPSSEARGPGSAEPTYGAASGAAASWAAHVPQMPRTGKTIECFGVFTRILPSTTTASHDSSFAAHLERSNHQRSDDSASAVHVG